MPNNCTRLSLFSLLAINMLLSACAVVSPPSEPEVSPAVEQAYQRAIDSMKAGKHGIAIKKFKAVSKMNPALAGPYVNIGIIYLKLNKLKPAEQSLQKAIELNPKNRVAYNYLGIVYRQLGQFDDAEQSYLRAIQLDNNYGFAHLNLGILYDLYKADIQKALRHYQAYQDLAEQPDKMVDKWIIDIKRRDTAITQTKEVKG